jgi:hypothetical protein
MNPDIPLLSIDDRSMESTFKQTMGAETDPFRLTKSSEAESAPEVELAGKANIIEQVSQLPTRGKVALIRKLMTQLETEQIQSVVEFGLREVSDRDRRNLSTTTHHTRLLLKKDYSYQDRGLSAPTQYYVYLRRRKSKLDRYIGALFYIPQGCTLSYSLDAQERITFNPPYNIFQLRDANNPNITQIVRLVCLEPPPPDYTFDKRQQDVPDIRLHVEYLDSATYQPIGRHVYPFPICMYEGGQLDRYRWEVTMVTLPSETPFSHPSPLSTSRTEPFSETQDPGSQTTPDPVSSFDSPRDLAQPQRRVLDLPPTKSLTFYLSNPNDSDKLLKRMRLWVNWSEKAMPQSKWEVVQDGMVFTLMNAHFKRRILKFSEAQGTVILENSLPVVIKWFHDLGLAVSQAQQHGQYSAVQLKLAHNLFVDMSLPQTDPIIVLKKLFGIDFSKAASK